MGRVIANVFGGASIYALPSHKTYEKSHDNKNCPDKKIYPGSFYEIDVIFPKVDADVLPSRL